MMLLALALASAPADAGVPAPTITRVQLVDACRSLATTNARSNDTCRSTINKTLEDLHPTHQDTTAKSCLVTASLSRRKIVDQIIRSVQLSAPEPARDTEDASLFVARIILHEFPCGIRSFW